MLTTTIKDIATNKKIPVSQFLQLVHKYWKHVEEDLVSARKPESVLLENKNRREIYLPCRT